VSQNSCSMGGSRDVAEPIGFDDVAELHIQDQAPGEQLEIEAGDEIATTGAVVSGAAVVEKLPSVLVARLPAASRDLTR